MKSYCVSTVQYKHEIDTFKGIIAAFFIASHFLPVYHFLASLNLSFHLPPHTSEREKQGAVVFV